MKQVEIKFTVHIYKVKLQVRFPCSLYAHLKIQNEQLAFGSDVPLRLGEAIIDHSTSLKFNLGYDCTRNTLADKKISICIFLTTSSGRIPAGTAFINTNYLQKGLNKISLGIEKCPDKNACIEATVNCDFEPPSYNLVKESKKQIKIGNQEPNYYASIVKSEQRIEDQQKSVRIDKTITEIQQQIQPINNTSFHSRNTSRQMLQIKSDRQYINNIQSPFQFSAKSKNSDLQREIKTMQKRYEQASMELKSANTKREMVQKALKESEAQAKIYKQKYEDIQQATNHLHKRNQFKQSSYKQQIKILTEKLTASENQKQAMIFQKNELVNTFEERQKNLRLTHREKEKQVQDEKGKAIKKSEQVSKELADLKQKLSESEFKISQSSKELTHLVKKNEVLEEKYQNIITQVDQLKGQLAIQKTKKEQLQQALNNRTEIEQQKKKLKRKITEGEEQISKLLKVIAVSEANNQKSVKRVEELEASLKEKLVQLKNFQRDNEMISKQREGLKKIIDEKEKKIQQTTNFSKNESAKIESLNQQIKTNEKKYLEEVKSLKKQLKDRQTKISNFSQQLEDNQLALNECNSRIKKYEVQIEVFNRKVATTDAELTQLQSKNEQLLLQITELDHHLALQRQAKQNTENSYSHKVEQLNEDIKAINDRLQQAEQQKSDKQIQLNEIIAQLQEKYTYKQQQLKNLNIIVEQLKLNIICLQRQKLQKSSSNEELQHDLKLKNKEIIFLKQSVQKSNKQITELITSSKELNNEIEGLKIQIVKYQSLIQNLNIQLQENRLQKSQGSNKFQSYIHKNKSSITQFLSAILKGNKIQTHFSHEDSDLHSLIQETCTYINELYTSHQRQVERLRIELQNQEQETIRAQKTIQKLTLQVQIVQKKLQEKVKQFNKSNQSSDTLIHELEVQIGHAQQNISKLENQIKSQKNITAKLREELTAANTTVEDTSYQNSTLRQKIEDLEESLKQKEEEYSTRQSRQSDKFEEETTNLRSIIVQLQNQIKTENQRSQQLQFELTQLKNEHEILLQNSKQSSGKLRAEYNQLNEKYKLLIKQVESYKQALKNLEEQWQDLSDKNKQLQSQLEEKSSQITLMLEQEASIASKLSQQITKGSDLQTKNDTLKQKLSQALQKQQDLQSVIYNLKNGQSELNSKQSDMQKALKEKSAEIISLSQRNYKLEQEKAKLEQDLDIANAMIGVKANTEEKLSVNIQQLQAQVEQLNRIIASQQKSASEQATLSKNQVANLQLSIESLKNELKIAQLKLEDANVEYQKLQQSSKQMIEQQDEKIQNLDAKNKQLQQKIINLTKNYIDLEKMHAVEDQLVKPIRDNLQLLRGHMAEYSRVGDQFESNKNKLLKAVSIKVELMNDKYVHDRMKDFSFAYNKLKLAFFGCNLQQQQKMMVGQQIKKVQMALDRVLRGQR